MTNQKWLDLATLPGSTGREDRQYGWQELFGRLVQNSTVLDVGAGLGLSRERLAAGGNKVTLQDVGPDLPVDVHDDVAKIESGSYDVVTCFDVIEHVQDDRAFLNHLRRIARRLVVVTTPNFLVSKCVNPYHCREYTPAQLVELVKPAEICLLMTGRDMKHRVHSKSEFLKHQEPSQAIVFSGGLCEKCGGTGQYTRTYRGDEVGSGYSSVMTFNPCDCQG